MVYITIIMGDTPGVFVRKQVAEFNTSQDSLKQIATMEWNIDEMFRLVYCGGIDKSDNEGIVNLYHYLVYIYADRLFALSWSTLQPKFDAFEKELELLYIDWKKNHPGEVPMFLLKRLRFYKRWLYEVKQKQIKLGVPTRNETTAKERMEKAAGV